jgi:hypothetical protein
LWIFSEARDLFVNIFRISDRTEKFVDRGLIIKKLMGFSAKMELLNFRFSDLFCNGKSLDSVHASWTTASGRSTVDLHGGMDGKPPESDRGGALACRCSLVAAGKGNGGVRNSPQGSPGEVVAVVGLDGSVFRCEGGGERGGQEVRNRSRVEVAFYRGRGDAGAAGNRRRRR